MNERLLLISSEKSSCWDTEGMQVISGQTDIEVVFYDKYNQPKELAKRCCLKSSGTQFAEIKIRGFIKKSYVDSKGRKIIY